MQKYQEFARAQRHQFFPMALETTGGMGKKCVELISLLIAEGKNTLRWAPREIVSNLKRSLCVRVQRWNAEFVSAVLNAHSGDSD